MKFAEGECERVRRIMTRLDGKTVKGIADRIVQQEEKKKGPGAAEGQQA